MKKIILSVSMALMSTVAFSQIETGTKFLGGTFGFSSGSSETSGGGVTADGPSTSSFQIAPSFGYMVTDNIGAGLRIGINNSSSTITSGNNNELEDKSNITTVGAFGRYYLPVAGDALFFHADLGFDIGFGSNESQSEDFNIDPNTGNTVTTVVTNESDVSTFSVGISPGFDYFVGEKWAIEMNWGFLGYNTSTTEAGNTEFKSSGIDVNFDFTRIGIGARWYF
ncbi:MAG: hypothetical protein ACJASF_002399 [Vicingaceae bacterium]|jgi:hypothetical protein